MFVLALLGCALFGVLAPSSDGADWVEYESRRAAAGREPAAHIKLALWCESHGMPAERLKHLAMAAMADPANPVARGLMGLVADKGFWLRPEEIADRAKSDAEFAATSAEYRERRGATKDDAGSQSALAAWCEGRGLHAEATAHLHRVVQLDPKRESAWKTLGYRKIGNSWVTDAQAAAARADAEARTKADRYWRPILERARAGANGGGLKPDASRIVAAIDDPRAVPSVMAVFGRGAAIDQRIAVEILGQLDTVDSSIALASLAVFGKSTGIKRVATEILRQRDPREYAGPLIGLLRDPVKYSVKRVGGPGEAGELWVEGKRFDRKRLYQSAAPRIAFLPGDFLTRDANGQPVLNRPMGIVDGRFSGLDLFDFAQTRTLPGVAAGQIPFLLSDPATNSPELDHEITALQNAGIPALGFFTPRGEFGRAALWIEANDPSSHSGTRFINPGSNIQMQLALVAQVSKGRLELEARKSVSAAQAQLDRDVAQIEAHNAPIHKFNDKVLAVLGPATGRSFGEDAAAWNAWFVDQVGYSLIRAQVTARETIVDVIQPYQPHVPVDYDGTLIAYHRVSCFAAGTPVRALEGDRPIESLNVGDLVLSQDEASGALAYQPILTVHRNPPAATLKIDLGGDSILASTYHRFWKPGIGWAMARELKPGDRLRTVGGVATIREIVAEEVQPVFNLDVAGSRTFFVGKSGALAHDNSVPDRRATPFDAPASD